MVRNYSPRNFFFSRHVKHENKNRHSPVGRLILSVSHGRRRRRLLLLLLVRRLLLLLVRRWILLFVANGRRRRRILFVAHGRRRRLTVGRLYRLYRRVRRFVSQRFMLLPMIVFKHVLSLRHLRTVRFRIDVDDREPGLRRRRLPVAPDVDHARLDDRYFGFEIVPVARARRRLPLQRHLHQVLVPGRAAVLPRCRGTPVVPARRPPVVPRERRPVLVPRRRRPALVERLGPRREPGRAGVGGQFVGPVKRFAELGRFVVPSVVHGRRLGRDRRDGATSVVGVLVRRQPAGLQAVRRWVPAEQRKKSVGRGTYSEASVKGGAEGAIEHPDMILGDKSIILPLPPLKLTTLT